MAPEMLLLLALVLECLGFVTFITIGFLVLLFVVAELLKPLLSSEVVAADDVDLYLSALVAFLVALVFLFNFIATLVLMTDCKSCGFWKRWQTSTFLELMDLLGKPKKSMKSVISSKSSKAYQKKKKKQQRLQEEHLNAMEGVPADERVAAREGSLDSSEEAGIIGFLPIEGAKAPKSWTEAPEEPHFLGFAHKNGWSYQERIPESMIT